MNDIVPAAQANVGELDRRTYLGSSDIAAILGLSPWKTPLDVYFEKLGMPKPIDAAKEKLFKRGKRMEPVVLDMLAGCFNREPVVQPVPFATAFKCPPHGPGLSRTLVVFADEDEDGVITGFSCIRQRERSRAGVGL